ncbi:aromatase/cyclase [Actinoplanes sp. NPDC049548]|uniref:aromatase/cyclase n=1 Tax=Actinoplanes sp. NPDC049548 TaxID=3155152 RepID=UPI003431D3BF
MSSTLTAATQPVAVQHEITIAAPPAAVYEIIRDVAAWPLHFAPTVHAERVFGDDRAERIRIWATANGEIKTWTSWRTLDPEAFRITFRQEVSQPPVASMGGAWQLSELPGGGTLVTLTHDFRAVGDDPGGIEWITAAVDRNSTQELAGLKATVENAGPEAFTFEDSLYIDGGVADVYDFLYQAARWPDRLPHVARMRVTENTPNLQLMEMDTSTRDGSVHTTTSVRVCFPPDRIVYKQIATPALMTLHTGEWVLTPTGAGVTATSRHTVRIKAEAVEAVLGQGATVDDARAYIRKALGTNSSATLSHAKEYAEGLG